MKTKINTSVDTNEAEKELANAKKVLKQLIGTKDKIILQIDTLDILDKNYDRKYDDLQKRLDTIYDKIGDAEDLVSETEDKLSNIQKDKITGDNIYNYLLMFDSVYDVLSDMEKKQFYNALLTDIQIYEEEQDKQIIKSIGFKFPVFYDGEFTKRIIRDKEKTVETVVLLSQLKQKPDDYINVTIELDDMDITSAETKATYDEIKKYVAEHNAGMKVSNLYISQVKRKCGIEVGKNLRVATRRMDCLQGNSTTAATDLELVPSPNLPKNEDSRQPQCPEDKESAIVEALKHFKMNS